MEKVENIIRPLIIGESLLVPCVINGYNITPIVNHPHNDVENGQPETHYHADYRFIHFFEEHNTPIIENGIEYTVSDKTRITKTNDIQIKYFSLIVIRTSYGGVNSPDSISKSKLKHKCIHKGKCSHRGFDLSQVEPVDGVITCPLHGLRYNAETKQLIDC